MSAAASKLKSRRYADGFPMLIRARFRQIFGAAVVIVGLGGVPLFGLQLHGERALPTDLAVTGRLAATTTSASSVRRGLHTRVS